MTTPGFYEDALTSADRDALAAATRVQGLLEEIALLRMKLRETVRDDPSNWESYLEHVKQLVEATLAQQKLAAGDSRDLTDAVNGWLGEFAEALRGYNPASPTATEEKPL